MTAPNPDTLKRLVDETPGARWVASELPDGTVGEGAWVPYGPGFEIPLYIEYEGERPLNWRVRIGVIDGRPQCLDFSCDNAGAPVTPEILHRFPLGRMIEEAVLLASRPADEIPRSYKRWDSVEQARDARAAVARHYRKRPGNGRRQRVLTDDFLREVAVVYREHVATGKPSKAVEEHFHYRPASARRVVREARLRGFLGPAHAGRGGEQTKKGDDDG